MADIAVIGGTGFECFPGAEILRSENVGTPFGRPSAALEHVRLGTTGILFLSRHGTSHGIPPHRVNYRANIRALHDAGVSTIIGVAAVGGISTEMRPARVVIPDQLIDYTWGRAQTFFDGDDDAVHHIDFTRPYCDGLRTLLLESAAMLELGAADRATYGATPGPRLETAAEIDRMQRDGCDVVGMTGMPEAALARELGLCYACCAVVANAAAGRGEGEITMEDIQRNLDAGMQDVQRLIAATVESL